MSHSWQRPQSPQFSRFCAVTRYEGGASIAACGGRWATSSTHVLIGVDVGKLECPACRDALAAPAVEPWTGPDDRDFAVDGVSLRWSVPGSRWPFGPPSFHEDICNLRPQTGRPGGLYCDCKASDASDRTHGETSHTAPIERDPVTRGLSELRDAPAIRTAELHTAPRDGVLFAFDMSEDES